MPRAPQSSALFSKHRSFIPKIIAPATVLVPLLVLFPAPARSQKKQKEVKGALVRLTAAVPSLAPLEETAQSQTKGGLRVTLAPETYKAQESWSEESRQIPPKGWLVVQPAPNAIYVEKTRTPVLAVSPDRLVFHIRLNNGMARVFRGAGIAVQFNIAGKISASDPSGYGDLTNLIIPPRGEQEVTILGPKVADIPAPSTVGVFLYDVVTAMDPAGNVTEKQNFEWYFSYQAQTVEKEVNVPPPQQGWVIPH
jgi:hypothetical protein